PEALMDLYQGLVLSPFQELRQAALYGVKRCAQPDTHVLITNALVDEEPSIRHLAATLLEDVLCPQHKDQLRVVLDALDREQEESTRLALLRGLLCLVDGSPADRLLVLELQPLLKHTKSGENKLALQILKRLRLGPSASLSSDTLRILKVTTDADTYFACVTLLGDVLIHEKYEEALHDLAHGLIRFSAASLQDCTYELMLRLADEETINALLQQIHSRARLTTSAEVPTVS
ncbi:MAG: hypothetical protein AAGJ35_13260, partial [Myxococcota bacterium]